MKWPFTLLALSFFLLPVAFTCPGRKSRYGNDKKDQG